ncbi:MAG: O-methyltransferase [Planctomycetota bacterium]|nr:O-methyltransferase [Planctomycetota bacterium]
MSATYPDLETYRRALFAPEDEVLAKVMPEAVAEGLPKISVNAEAGQALNFLARAVGAKKILEFGALAGYSGIWLARALPPGGKLVSLEVNPKHAEVTRANFKRAGVADRAEVRLGQALELLESAKADAPFDMAFIDADKENYPKYLDFALAHVRVGGIVCADNANGHGHAHEVLPADDPRRGLQVYNERVTSDPRLVSVCLPFGGWLAVSLKVRE